MHEGSTDAETHEQTTPRLIDIAKYPIPRLHELERDLTEMRTGFAANEGKHTETNVRNAFAFMKAFYDAPAHRLDVNTAMRAAAAAGYTAEDLEEFRSGPEPALHDEGGGYMLTEW